jgi:hypothetical protein
MAGTELTFKVQDCYDCQNFHSCLGGKLKCLKLLLSLNLGQSPTWMLI